MKPKLYWIKKRHNPQLGVYWTACGQLSKTAAKKHERTLYGTNYMHSLETEEQYKAELIRLRIKQ